MTLTDFLLARIAEDEAAADLVLRPYGEHASTNDAAWWRNELRWFEIGLSSDETPLLMRFTPQRVLAQCEAARRIVELHSVARKWVDMQGFDQPDYREPEDSCGTCGWVPTDSGCPTLRALALPYADHEEFREGWRS